eukprot:1139457-Pelagomonas_calceolata.AAC.3
MVPSSVCSTVCPDAYYADSQAKTWGLQIAFKCLYVREQPGQAKSHTDTPAEIYKHHEVAGGMITKALSISPWGAGMVSVDVGSDDQLAQHNPKIPAHASHRTTTPSLFPHRFPSNLDSPPAVLMLC